jgi:short chain dehydrogenase
MVHGARENAEWSGTLFSIDRPIMVRSRRESHHSDGITDQKSLQRTSATKSTQSGHFYAPHITGQAFDRPQRLCGVSTILKAILKFLGVDMPGYFDLSERVALVTGASRGLGLAMADALAEAGATVVLNGRDANTLKAAADRIRDRGLNAETSAFDVTDRRAADSAIRSVVTRHQRLDILIANAGITHRAQLAEWTSEAWDAVLAANLSACFFWPNR